MAGTDDLAPLLTVEEDADGRVVMGQATITSYDPSNNTHTLNFRGSQISDVGVVHGISAMGYEPGHVVLLQGWVPKKGTSTWWILGRALIPGQDSPDLVVRGGSVQVEGGGSVQVSDGGSIEATDGPIIASDGSGDVFRVDPTVPEIFMRQSLISDLAKAIIGDAFRFDFVSDRDEGDTESFVDLDTVGPEVTSVDVANGTMVIILSARIEVTAGGGAGSGGNGHMSYEVDGPTNRSPSIQSSASLLFSTSSSDLIDVRPTCAAVHVETGLASGSYDVTAKYQTGSTGAFFSNRGMLVIGF